VTIILIVLVFLATQDWIYWLLGEKKPGDNLALAIGLYTFALAFQIVLRQMLQGFFRFRQMALIEVAGGILTLTMLAVLLIWFQVGLIGAIYARTFGILVAWVYYLAAFTKGLFSLQHIDRYVA
jgi:O-antigen/teichoic acid export membrane protein